MDDDDEDHGRTSSMTSSISNSSEQLKPQLFRFPEPLIQRGALVHEKKTMMMTMDDVPFDQDDEDTV